VQASSPGVNVLFVDDEPAILKGFARALQKEPYGILTAVSPTLALEILASHSVDIVVSDERMPGGSGSAFLRRVSEQSPDVVRILLTGDAGLDGAVRAIRDGKLYRFLNKPVTIDELSRTLRNAIQFKRVNDMSARLRHGS